MGNASSSRRASAGLLIGFAAVVLALLAVIPGQARAASYRNVEFDQDTNLAKTGSYYLWMADYDDIRISTSKNGTYDWTPLPSYGIVSNGKKAYYMYNQSLYVYNLKTGSDKLVKTFSTYYSLGGVYNGKAYLTRTDEAKWTQTTYSFNMKSKKLKRAKKKCNIIAANGKYMVGMNEFATDVSAHKMTLYKAKGSGLKKVKKLASYGFTAKFVGSKLYYMSYASGAMRKGSLYRCTKTGKNKKKLGTFKGVKSNGYRGQVVVSDITSKSCKVTKPGGDEPLWYKYTYKTKKLKRIYS